MNCPSKTTGHLDHNLKQIIDDFDLVQHINEPTHKRDGLLNFVIAAPRNPHVTNTRVEDLVPGTLRRRHDHPGNETPSGYRNVRV